MKHDDKLLWILGALLLLGGGGVAVYTMTRGLRNNNPGNIRHGDQWYGMSPTQSDSEFVTFDSPVMGLRALMTLLHNYYTRYGLDTVQDIISRWAPPTENDTQSYIQNVANHTGFEPLQILDLKNSTTLIALAQAITSQENGLIPYALQDFQTAAGMVIGNA